MRAVSARGRFANYAAQRMQSVGTICRRGATQAQNETSGRTGYVWTPTYSATPLRLSGQITSTSTKRGATTQHPGHVEVPVAIRTVHLPLNCTDLQVGDVVQITAGDVPGTFWRINEATWQDQATARRVPVEQIDRPEGWPS